MIVATFVSNSRYYNYPVELWERELKHFETRVFAARKVLKPEDIAIIQNECLTKLFKTHKTVLWLQADLIFDIKKTDRLHEIVKISKQTDAMCLLTMAKAKLFLSDGLSGYGAAIIKKESFINDKNHRFCERGDGAYGGYHHHVTNPNDIIGFDVGYLGLKNYTDHFKQQATIWKQGGTYDLYSLRNGFIDENVFRAGMDYFNLWAEFNEFKKNFKNRPLNTPKPKKRKHTPNQKKTTGKYFKRTPSRPPKQ